MVDIPEEWVEVVSRIMAQGWRGNPHMSGDDRNFMPEGMRRRHDARARAALTAVLPLILERAAGVDPVQKVAMRPGDSDYARGWYAGWFAKADAIRALWEPKP